MSKLFKKDANAPRIYFNAVAWAKTFALARGADTTECAINGFVFRSGNDFLIEEVSVYPQVVQPAFVTDDDARYVEWLLEIPEEKANRIRFQAHSHVNMGVTPSKTDDDTWFDTASMSPDYYIFMIVNKRGEFSIFLYDNETNTIYDKEDLVIDIVDDGGMPLTMWYATECAHMLRKPSLTEIPDKTVIKKGTSKKPKINSADEYDAALEEQERYLAKLRKERGACYYGPEET